MAKEFLLFFALVLTSEIEAKKPKAGNYTPELTLKCCSDLTVGLSRICREYLEIYKRLERKRSPHCKSDAIMILIGYVARQWRARAPRGVSASSLLLSASVSNSRLQI